MPSGFPGGSDVKESAWKGDMDSIPGLGRSPGEGNGYPLQYSCLDNSMDRGAWWAIVHGAAKSWTWLSDWLNWSDGFYCLGSIITLDSDCSPKIKRHLFFGRKAMANIDSLLRNRDITLLTEVHIVKAMIFPVVMYRCENWTIKKAEHQTIGTFKLWC